MASGDVVSQMVDIAAGGTSNYQPAASVEVCVMTAGGENANAIVRLTDGTEVNNHWEYASVTINWNINGSKLFINNTNYLQLHNPSGANPYVVSFTGIQIK